MTTADTTTTAATTTTTTTRRPLPSCAGGTRTGTPQPLAPHGALTRRLDREWAHLRRRPPTVRAARAWRPLITHRRLAELLSVLDDLHQLVEATQSGRPDADGVLLELVDLAQGEQLAGRIVVQRLLPALIARAAPYRSHRDDLDPAELAVPAAWLAIRHDDTGRRRRHVAASLVSDATDQAFRRPLRRRWAGERPFAPSTFLTRPVSPAPTPMVELAGVIREADAAGVASTDLDLLRELVRAGSPSIVARDHGVTTRTIRNRRDRAVARIRAALGTP
jgi:hypothetical protein